MKWSYAYYSSILTLYWICLLLFSCTMPQLTVGTSVINPIHKKGSKMDPSNYRGISLLFGLSKSFTAILNQHLKYVLQNQILSKEQLGFIPGNRTSDALLLLHNLVDQHCKQYNNNINAFVDFQKVFDSVPRHKLFEKLINYNITGRFYECIKHLYSSDLSCIKIENRITDTFQNRQGVKQGCILSPLFNIFFADLQKKFQEDRFIKIKPKWNDMVRYLGRWFAAQSEKGLNRILTTLNAYSQENLIEINVDKTKCMIFIKIGRHKENVSARK